MTMKKEMLLVVTFEIVEKDAWSDMIIENALRRLWSLIPIRKGKREKICYWSAFSSTDVHVYVCMYVYILLMCMLWWRERERREEAREREMWCVHRCTEEKEKWSREMKSKLVSRSLIFFDYLCETSYTLDKVSLDNNPCLHVSSMTWRSTDYFYL